MARMKTLGMLGFILCCATSAFAAKRESKESAGKKEATERAAAREAKERAAKKACLNGDPAKGVELLTDLYVDSNDPTYIYNQGRCFEQNDRCEDAIVRFREYLRKTVGGSESDHNDVQKHITDCEALLAKKAAEAAVPPAAVSAAGQPMVPPPPSTQPMQGQVVPLPPPAAVIVAAPQAPSPAGAGLRVAGVVTMVVGAAAVGTGLALNLKHNSMIHDLQSDYSGDTADSAQTYETLSVAGYGVGAACLVGGATLYLLGHRAGKSVVAPTVVAGKAGLLVAGGF